MVLDPFNPVSIASWALTQRAVNSGLLPSLGSVGDCYDCEHDGGCCPAQGAEATRRYVRRIASIVVMEHHKRESPDRFPWTHVGISERRLYKLLPLFAAKTNGHYDHDHVIARMKAHFEQRDREREVRAATLDLLRERDFSEAAARKWLQRHRAEQAIDAWPRGRQPGEAA